MKARNGRRDAGQGLGTVFPEPERDRSWLREGLILLAFVLLTAAGVMTVVVPQLEEQPGERAASGEGRAAEGDAPSVAAGGSG